EHERERRPRAPTVRALAIEPQRHGDGGVLPQALVLEVDDRRQRDEPALLLAVQPPRERHDAGVDRLAAQTMEKRPRDERVRVALGVAREEEARARVDVDAAWLALAEVEGNEREVAARVLAVD